MNMYTLTFHPDVDYTIIKVFLKTEISKFGDKRLQGVYIYF